MTMQPLKAHVKNGRLAGRPARHVRPHPEDEADVRAGLAEAERGEGVRLTSDQLEQWATTGELPCLESSSSRRGT